MTEPTVPPPEPDPEVPPHTPPPARLHAPLLPWLTGAGFLIMAAALSWVWRHPDIPAPSTEQTDALARQIGVLDARVTRVEQRPQPQPVDLGPLTTRLAALEQRPAPQAGGPASPSPTPDLGPLAARVAALEQRPPPNLAPLEARIAALEARQPAENQLAARIGAVESAQGAMQADLSRRFATAETAAKHAARVQSAALALASGRKLGDLPQAPPALARFANANPPTEAALRLAFPQAARDALAAAHPATDGKPLLTRLWAEAQDLVTIRQGDHVLIGDPTAGVLERARSALDAGDLASAAAAVATLQGAAAQAMAAWLDQAHALLEARAALAAWAAAG